MGWVQTPNQTTGRENIFSGNEGSTGELYSHCTYLRYKLYSSSAKVASFPSVYFIVTLLGLHGCCELMNERVNDSAQFLPPHNEMQSPSFVRMVKARMRREKIDLSA